MKKGKLIVIEGSDGSGKTTQIKLLTNFLSKNNISYSSFDFPQYGKTFFGDFVGHFLNGKFGHFSRINPYLAMFPYAGDRWQVKDQIHKALETSKIVICNRYAPSIAYQLAKVKPKEKNEFVNWSFTLEYKVFGIPKEDAVIFLYVPVSISQQLMEKRVKKEYLKGKTKDQYEKDINYLNKVEKEYLNLIKKYKHWVKINCVKEGKILPPEVIHQKIIEILKKKGYI